MAPRLFGTDGVRGVDQAAHVVDGAEHVGDRSEGEESRPGEETVEVGEVELVPGRDRDEAQLDAALLEFARRTRRFGR